MKNTIPTASKIYFDITCIISDSKSIIDFFSPYDNTIDMNEIYVFTVK